MQRVAKQTEQGLQFWREAVPEDRVTHLVRDVSRALTHSLQTRLATRSIPIGQWAFLRILWVRDGLTQKELSDHAGVMEPTTFVALKAMEAQGLVVRKHHPDNQKNMYVSLTAKGRALEKKLVPLAVEVNALASHRISKADLATTQSTLQRIAANLSQEPTAAKPARKRPSSKPS